MAAQVRKEHKGEKEAESGAENAFVVGWRFAITLFSAGKGRCNNLLRNVNLPFENYSPKLLGVRPKSDRGFFVKPRPEQVHGVLQFVFHFLGGRMAGDSDNAMKRLDVLGRKTIQLTNQNIQRVRERESYVR